MPDHPHSTEASAGAGLLGSVDYVSWLASSPASAAVVVPLLQELIAADSVVDVGCGLGAWLAAFRSHGVEDVLGLDGAWVDRSALAIPQDRFVPADLAHPIAVDRRFDLALCLEVAHLLQPSHAPQLVTGLAGLADVVCLSAGIPGQPGIQHVNLQWPAYWAELFSRHGYRPCDPLRARLWEDDAVAWWFAQNLLVYATDEALDRLPGLAAARCAGDRPRPLVHPTCYLARVDDASRRRALPRLRRLAGRVLARR